MSVNRKVTVPEGRSERTAVMMRQSKGFGQRGRDVPAVLLLHHDVGPIGGTSGPAFH
jgi:hypothetical protein